MLERTVYYTNMYHHSMTGSSPEKGVIFDTFELTTNTFPIELEVIE